MTDGYDLVMMTPGSVCWYCLHCVITAYGTSVTINSFLFYLSLSVQTVETAHYYGYCSVGETRGLGKPVHIGKPETLF